MNSDNFSGSTGVDTWTVEELVDAVNSRILNKASKKKRSVDLPKYQRSLVWSDDFRKDFIMSIKKGYPFGSLLLYKVVNEEGIEKFRLIDGLQRTSTLIEYTKRPTTYFTAAQIPEELLQSILEILNISDSIDNKQHLKEIVAEWIISREGFEQRLKYTPYYLVKEILSKLKLSIPSDRQDKLIESEAIVNFMELVEKDANILNSKIPVVVYYGAEANLPTIFEKLNSRGTKLNKYQIFAASWATTYGSFKITDKDIKEQIKAKYDSLSEAGFQIADYDPDITTFYDGDFTYFEYVFGLGKLLVSKYPELFGYIDEDDFADSTESIGFNLCAACLGFELAKIIKLPEKLKELFKLPNGQKLFRAAIEDATNFVSKILTPITTLQANRKKNSGRKSSNFTLYHTELQIVSLIAKVFVCKYDLTILEELKEWKNLKEQVLMNSIEHHYIYDIINDDWRGSGDIKVSQLAQINSRYDNPIPRSSWNNLLDEWFERQLQRSETTRVIIKESDILFLKVIYANTMSVKEDKGTIEYEIEHLVPFARLRDSINEEAKITHSAPKGFPISAVSNLCLLKKLVNQDKKDKTIYEYYEEQVKKEKIDPTEAHKKLRET